MLQILQTRNIDSYRKLIDSLDLSDKYPCVVEATENDSVTGIGVYHFLKDGVAVDYIDSNNDLYLYDGIVRSILFLACNKGFDRAVFLLSDNSLLKKLQIITDDKNCIEDIDTFLSECKNCKKK